jgi:hypothetical protein
MSVESCRNFAGKTTRRIIGYPASDHDRAFHLQQLFAAGAATWQLSSEFFGASFFGTDGVSFVTVAQQLVLLLGAGVLSRPARATLEPTAANRTAARRRSLEFMMIFGV